MSIKSPNPTAHPKIWTECMEIDTQGLTRDAPSSRPSSRFLSAGNRGERSSVPPARLNGSHSPPPPKSIAPSPGSGPPPSRQTIPPPATCRPAADRLASFGPLVAESAAMQGTLATLARYAPTDVSITLIGETGTGKDVLAHAIHAQSARASGNFVVFDCGAVAANLAESELLGHERGSFTGAINAHAGAFERADGGTLFLDEIGELPLDLQPKLLRALENRRARRVGGKEDRPFDVRVIAATNRDLQAEVSAGRFRRDIYFRLGSAVVSIPPLRERLDDLPILTRSILDDLGRSELEVSDGALMLLRLRSWPGNVRELKNTLACALAFLNPEDVEIGAQHVTAVFDSGAVNDGDIDRLPLGGLRLERIERAAIRQTLTLSGGNKVRAAQLLGIAVSTLYEKLKKHGQVHEEPRESLPQDRTDE